MKTWSFYMKRVIKLFHAFRKKQCVKVMLSSWGRLQRRREDKITFSLVYRTLFFDMTCGKLNWEHSFFSSVRDRDLRARSLKIVFFDTSAKKWFYPRVDVLKVHERIKFLFHSCIEHYFLTRRVGSSISSMLFDSSVRESELRARGVQKYISTPRAMKSTAHGAGRWLALFIAFLYIVHRMNSKNRNCCKLH